MFTKKEIKNIVNSGRTRSYVPDVTIDKMNISYSSRADTKRQTAKAAKMTRNKYGSVEYELNVTPTSNRAKSTVVKLNLSIHDVDKGTWFNDETSRKYLKVRVIQCSSAEITKKIIDGSINVYSRGLDRIAGIKEVLLSASKKGELKDYYHYSSGNGVIYKIPYEASFEVGDYSHVYYFAVCYMDVEEMVSDRFLTKNPRNLGRYRGKVAAEPLFVKSKKVNNRAAFVDQNGSIWQGPVNFGPGPTGINEGEINNLKRIRVGNSKIHDYILFDTLKKRIKFPEVSRDTKSYFSKSYMSRDKNNACRFIFNFDYLTAIRDNSKFGGLARSMPRGFKSARIKSIKVFRQRIFKENYSATNGSLGLNELICYSADTSAGTLRKSYNEVNLNKGKENDTYVGAISETRLKNADNLRSFMVFDNSMSLAEFCRGIDGRPD